MRIELFNCPIDAITMHQTLNKIENAIIQKQHLHHVVVNVAKLVHMQNNSELRESVVNCDIINADGQGVVWASKILGKKIPERVAGIDLMQNLVQLAHDKKYKIFFFGAEEHIVKEVVNKYTNQFSHSIIAGYRNGYFNKEEESEIANEIANSGANILFVAMGSPKKENFLFNYKQVLQKLNFVMGVGGSFDVVAGKVKRAPVWVQKIGMEWFYRMAQEPRRLFMRYFTTNLALIKLILKEKLKKG
ncbi:MAG TPA: WecB/TagA/CpsF family glycosyltransferase [Chitinophagaceae bacterium]|nr:WecB/TagA/CpsF family glycosyltransferase [Chitinophagaceae bacterium]